MFFIIVCRNSTFLIEWSCWIAFLIKIIITTQKASLSFAVVKQTQTHRSTDYFYFPLICGLSLSISRTNAKATMSIILDVINHIVCWREDATLLLNCYYHIPYGLSSFCECHFKLLYPWLLLISHRAVNLPAYLVEQFAPFIYHASKHRISIELHSTCNRSSVGYSTSSSIYLALTRTRLALMSKKTWQWICQKQNREYKILMLIMQYKLTLWQININK